MIPAALAVLGGLLGAAAGSLVALAVERMPRDLPVLAHPFRCAACRGSLPGVARIPVAGALLAGGACPACGAPSLRRKAIIEAATAASFALVAWRFGVGFPTVAFLWYAAVFIAVFAIDLEHRLILNRMMYPAIVLAPVAALMTGLSLPSSLLGGAIGFGTMYLLYVLARGGLGGGDVKLGLFIGLITGAERVLWAMLAFSTLAGLVSALLLLTRKKGRRDYIPFGPFMVLGAVAALLRSW
ncbi:MAG: prepilin peptidase [Chloroflexi bacterium]|nr:prepilin peptidase [Chloroflexota bacterium]